MQSLCGAQDRTEPKPNILFIKVKTAKLKLFCGLGQ